MGVMVVQPGEDVDVLAGNLHGSAAEVIPAFSPDQDQFHLLPAVLLQKPFCRAHDVGVEGSAKSPVAGEHQGQQPLLGPPGEQGMLLHGGSDRQTRQHFFDEARIRAGVECAFLSAPQLGRRNHFHGFGDLLRVAHRADPPAHVNQARHKGKLLAQAVTLVHQPLFGKQRVIARLQPRRCSSLSVPPGSAL